MTYTTSTCSLKPLQGQSWKWAKVSSKIQFTKLFCLTLFISSFSKYLLSIYYVASLCLAQGIQWRKQPDNEIHLCHLFSHSKSVRKTREKLATFLQRRNRSLMKLCNLPKITQLEREKNQACPPLSTTPRYLWYRSTQATESTNVLAC